MKVLGIVFSFIFSFVHLYALDIVTLATPFVNHHVFVDEEFLSEHVPGEKGGREIIDYHPMRVILNASHQEPQIELSGSGMDVTYTLAHLGVKCKSIGQIGEDAISSLYKSDLKKNNIQYRFVEAELPTGQVLCIVTPDGQRTMRTFLGAATHPYGSFKIEPKDFEDAKVFHVEGYQLDQPHFVRESMKRAKEKGLKVSLDLACFEIVREFRADIFEMLMNYVDIVFANEDETKELLNLGPTGAVEKLSEMCEVAVVTIGERGGYVSSFGKTFHYPAVHVMTLDTTGAGDQFAAGFLYGYLKKMPLRKCANLGSKLASEVVQIPKTRHSEEVWTALLEELNDLDML